MRFVGVGFFFLGFAGVLTGVWMFDIPLAAKIVETGVCCWGGGVLCSMIDNI